jgi:hypothetical protein
MNKNAISNAARQSPADPSSNLRAALGKHADLRAEIDRTKQKGAERQRRYDQLVASGAFDDESKAAEATTLHVQIQMVDPAVKRLADQAAALIPAINAARSRLSSVAAEAGRLARAEIVKRIGDALSPVFEIVPPGWERHRTATDALLREAEAMVSTSSIYRILGFDEGFGFDVEGRELVAAEHCLGRFETLVAALRLARPLLPEGFDAFARALEKQTEPYVPQPEEIDHGKEMGEHFPTAPESRHRAV